MDHAVVILKIVVFVSLLLLWPPDDAFESSMTKVAQLVSFYT